MMSNDLTDAIGVAVGRAARDAIAANTAKVRKRSNGPLSGAKGLAVGAGLATLVPLAGRGAVKLVKGGLGGNGAGPIEKLGDKVGSGAKDAVGSTIEKAGGAGSVAKEAAKGVLPGGGGKSEGVPGVGKGRRMPIQQSADVPVPVKTAYNQFTQFEEWPNFMHRVDRVSQDDDTHVSFKAKVWGKSKEFTAEIVEQHPDDRIKWRVTEGMHHEGVVTFHELADRLTRIEVTMDVEPGSLIEKAARGMRHVKRAVRADLARFKAYVVMQDEESGAWRGEVEDAEVTSTRRSSGGRKRSSSGGRKASSPARSRSSSSGAGNRSSSRSRGATNGGGTPRRKSGTSS